MGRRSQSRSSGSSLPCNGRLIRLYRERKGLTQAELAQQSGYSVRLIGKAEAGKPIKLDTIEILAEALSDANLILKPCDLISAPATLAEKYVQELLQHQGNVVQEIRHFLADDFELRCFSNDESLAIQGFYQGSAGLSQYADKLFRVVELPDGIDVSSCCSLFPVEDDVVVWYLFQPLLRSEVDPAAAKAGRSVSLTTKLGFRNGLLLSQEDRIVVH